MNPDNILKNSNRSPNQKRSDGGDILTINSSYYNLFRDMVAAIHAIWYFYPLTIWCFQIGLTKVKSNFIEAK